MFVQAHPHISMIYLTYMVSLAHTKVMGCTTINKVCNYNECRCPIIRSSSDGFRGYHDHDVPSTSDEVPKSNATSYMVPEPRAG